MSEPLKYNCHCGTETLVKKDGTPWKHDTPLGYKCFGSSDPEKDLSDVESSTYEYKLSVYPDPGLLEDREWQVSNLRMATVSASREGFTPTGEAEFVKQVPDGDKLLLIYEVPVKKG